jgi:DNA-binding response OmpR family regulator
MAIRQKKKKRILVVDDDPGIQDIFSIIFEKAGFIIDIKKDGEDLLKNKFTLPDLFLIDKQLSGYSGLDVCRHLKSQNNTKNIPVIMISAAPNIGALSQEAGADSYIEKPFEVKDLLRLVNFYANGNEERPSSQ